MSGPHKVDIWEDVYLVRRTTTDVRGGERVERIGKDMERWAGGEYVVDTRTIAVAAHVILVRCGAVLLVVGPRRSAAAGESVSEHSSARFRCS